MYFSRYRIDSWPNLWRNCPSPAYSVRCVVLSKVEAEENHKRLYHESRDFPGSTGPQHRPENQIKPMESDQRPQISDK